MTVTPTPPRNAIDSPAARTPRKRRRLTVVTMKMPGGIADAGSQKEPCFSSPAHDGGKLTLGTMRR
jgi:hypothetical protein